MKATETNGKIEIQAGRWNISVSESEAHAIRCVVAGLLLDIIPQDMAGKKPALESLVFDAATEHLEFATAGWTGKRLWLECAGLRVELGQVDALRLWKVLMSVGPPCVKRQVKSLGTGDVEDLLYDAHTIGGI